MISNDFSCRCRCGHRWNNNTCGCNDCWHRGNYWNNACCNGWWNNGCGNNWRPYSPNWGGGPDWNRPPFPWPPMNGFPPVRPRPPVITPPVVTPDTPDYGGRINTTAQTLTLAAGAPTAVPLAVTLPADGVTYLNPNAVTITEAGDYEIYYMLANATLEEGTPLTLQLRNNGVPIVNTAITDADGNVQGATIQTLAAGDVIDLIVTATGAVTLTLGAGTTAALLVRQLD